MPHRLETIFENLAANSYTITSAYERSYNCIAYAAGETHRWWWPQLGAYWPVDIPMEENVQSFILAFASIGYAACEHGDLEPDFEKVAIYADANRLPTHAARQLPSGLWTSKCGKLEDIEHTLEALVGISYGTVVQFLRRPR